LCGHARSWRIFIADVRFDRFIYTGVLLVYVESPKTHLGRLPPRTHRTTDGARTQDPPTERGTGSHNGDGRTRRAERATCGGKRRTLEQWQADRLIKPTAFKRDTRAIQRGPNARHVRHVGTDPPNRCDTL